jgi:hypothetical protein
MLSSGAMSMRSMPGADRASYQVSTAPLGTWSLDEGERAIPLAVIAIPHHLDQLCAAAGSRSWPWRRRPAGSGHQRGQGEAESEQLASSGTVLTGGVSNPCLYGGLLRGVSWPL